MKRKKIVRSYEKVIVINSGHHKKVHKKGNKEKGMTKIARECRISECGESRFILQIEILGTSV